MIKKQLQKEFDPTELQDMNFYYCGTNIEYDRDDSNCHCSPDYCRCSRLVNARVSSIQLHTIVKKLFDKKTKDEFLAYCVYQILSHSPYADPNTYNVNVVGGYYGEEIGGVSAQGTGETIKQLQNLYALKTDNERLLYILEQEYGFVLEALKSLDYTLQSVKVSDIVIPQTDHFQKLDKKRIDFYTAEENFSCVCREKDGKYYLVDGYHRLAAANRAGKKVIDVVVGKERV